MKKMMLLIMVTVFSSIGWKIGEKSGIMTAYFLGCVGSLIGIYVGVKINRISGE